MKYFLYERDTGKIRCFTEVPFLDVTADAFGYGVISAEGYSDADIPLFEVIDGALTPKAPPVVYASAEQIKTEWLRREQEPILVLGAPLDCDMTSETRMRDCLAVWDTLPIIPDQFDDVDGERKVRWTLADNSKVWLSFGQLQNILESLIVARAGRAAVLFSI